MILVLENFPRAMNRFIVCIIRLLPDMEVELEMYIDEKDESAVMKKVSELTKHAKELGFKIGEIELKNKDYDGYKNKEKRKEDKKHRHG
jgi:hypothetical protein